MCHRLQITLTIWHHSNLVLHLLQILYLLHWYLHYLVTIGKNHTLVDGDHSVSYNKQSISITCMVENRSLQGKRFIQSSTPIEPLADQCMHAMIVGSTTCLDYHIKLMYGGYTHETSSGVKLSGWLQNWTGVLTN